MWFITSDPDGDPDGISQIQWNLSVPDGSGFVMPNTAMITARISIDGNTPADLGDVVDRVEWNWRVLGADGSESSIMDIVPMSDPSADEVCAEISLLVNAKKAGLVEVQFDIRGYREDYPEDPVIQITRSLVIGSPLQLYGYDNNEAKTYAIFDEQTKEATIYANHDPNLEVSQIFWYFVDAEGEYKEATSQILLQNPDNLEECSVVSEIVKTPERDSTKPPLSLGAMKVIPYTIRTKETGGFTRLVGRIYFGGDSRAKEYVETTYDLIHAAEFKEKTLQLNYGDTRLYRSLANHKDSLGWSSYSSRNDVLNGVLENSVVELDADGIVAKNYGRVILEATAIYEEFENFAKIARNVTDLLEIYVTPTILKGISTKERAEQTEEIDVGDQITLSTNIEGNDYQYEWFVWDSSGENSVWVPITANTSNKFIQIVDCAQSENGYTSVTVKGKEKGETRIKCLVKKGSEVVLEQEVLLQLRAGIQLSLSEVRKTISVGNSFEIQAYLSELSSEGSVSWKVEGEWKESISIESIGKTSALVTGLAGTYNTPVLCTATYEVNGIQVSASFYVTVVPAIQEAWIEAAPSSVISVGDTVDLNLVLQADGLSFTKDQIKWVVKEVHGQGDPNLIIKKEDNSSNALQTTITGLAVGKAYVAAVINDSVQTEIAIITIEVRSNVMAIYLNANSVRGSLPGTFTLIATPLPEGYVNTEDLDIIWTSSNANIVSVTPDPDNPLKAEITYHMVGGARVVVQVSGRPEIVDFCDFTIEEAVFVEPVESIEYYIGEQGLAKKEIVEKLPVHVNVKIGTNPYERKTVTWNLSDLLDRYTLQDFDIDAETKEIVLFGKVEEVENCVVTIQLILKKETVKPIVPDETTTSIEKPSRPNRPSSDREDEDDEEDSSEDQNTPSNSDLTDQEQNRIEAALGSQITIQFVVESNIGKLVVTVGKEIVFCEKDGVLSKEKWQKADGSWYYFGSDSKAVDGWLKTGNKWYYLDQENKQMKTGWIQTVDGKWYLLDERNGDMKTDWQWKDGKWYLLDGINGDMKTGWQKKGDKWYLLDGINGDMKTGWQMVNGKWYYLTNSGEMAVNTKTPDGYQVDALGAWIP